MTAKIDVLIQGQYLAQQAFSHLQSDIRTSDDVVSRFSAKAVVGFNSLSGSLITLDSGIGVVTEAMQFAAQAYDAVIGKTMEYAQQVRDLSRTIGASAEETSALIQFADDFQVSYSSLTTGLETAIRKGVSPTIDGLAKLSKQYQSIQNPISQSRFLMETFGRAGADLAPLMAQGEEGIRKMADEVERLGLAMDEETLAKIEAYRQKIDSLGDKWQALTLKAGPPVIDVLSSAADAVLTTTDSVGRLNGALDEHNASMINSAQSYQEYIAEMERAKQAAISGAAATNLWLGPVGAMAAALQVNAHEIDIASRAEFDHQRQLAATEQAYLKSAAAALAYSQVVASGATQGVGGYMGWDPNRGSNPSRDNPVYDFLTPAPGRAGGGPGLKGMTYRVAEDGTEYLTLGQNGYFTPAGAGNASGGEVSVNLNMPSMFNLSDQSRASQVLEPIIRDAVRKMHRNGEL